MKILHTADWHIGQLFHEYDRSYEHGQFLNWLVETLTENTVDVLLISGDVYDISNPSANSVRLFYTFLNQATFRNPALQIIITAGNHDSPSRLESPKPLLESSNIHIIGLVQKDENGLIDYGKLLVPLKNKEGNTAAWCLAVPFLRMGDYPSPSDNKKEKPYKYSDGVAALYREAYQHALTVKPPDLPIIALGHLHAQHAEITDLDNTERQIMGGVECISTAAFHKDIRYVALGHIHKAQKLGGKNNIRYAGSPLPLSFSEINYKHQVVLFELGTDDITALEVIEVPVSVSLQRLPKNHGPLNEVLPLLEALPEAGEDTDSGVAPYLEVRVLLESPQPALRHKIEMALQGKSVRLAKIDVKYPSGGNSGVDADNESTTEEQLKALQPETVFNKHYFDTFKSDVPEEIQNIFNQAIQEVAQNQQ